MDTQFKVTSNKDKTGYNVLANAGPRTRYFVIGTVYKVGSKWSYNETTFPSKKVAVAACTGDYLIACAAARDRDADREAVNAAAPCQGEVWPGGCPVQEGDLVRHALGYEGPAVYCEGPRRDAINNVWRIGLRTQAGKALVIGTLGKEISRVEDAE
jgi:hypothetical protein